MGQEGEVVSGQPNGRVTEAPGYLYPGSGQVHPYDVIATLYHALGIDAGTEYRDALDRLPRLVEHGRPITGVKRQFIWA